jgi:predicted amidohydrolase
MHRRDEDFSRGTLYNTVVVIGADGAILNRHRKLMPTNPERMVWGLGDASGLRVVDTPCGRVGTLLCWESYMPLARYALYAQGVELYVAPTYDSGEGWIGTMQHIAREGCCWVVGSGFALRASDLPDAFPEGKALSGSRRVGERRRLGRGRPGARSRRAAAQGNRHPVRGGRSGALRRSAAHARVAGHYAPGHLRAQGPSRAAEAGGVRLTLKWKASTSPRSPA